jgi:hypothetical protein
MSVKAIMSWLAKLLLMAVGTVYCWVAVALMVTGLLLALPVLMAIGFALLAAPVIAAEVRERIRRP